jgi:hypothetical protein
MVSAEVTRWTGLESEAEVTRWTGLQTRLQPVPLRRCGLAVGTGCARGGCDLDTANRVGKGYRLASKRPPKARLAKARG